MEKVAKIPFFPTTEKFSNRRGSGARVDSLLLLRLSVMENQFLLPLGEFTKSCSKNSTDTTAECVCGCVQHNRKQEDDDDEEIGRTSGHSRNDVPERERERAG